MDQMESDISGEKLRTYLPKVVPIFEIFVITAVCHIALGDPTFGLVVGGFMATGGHNAIKGLLDRQMAALDDSIDASAAIKRLFAGYALGFIGIVVLTSRFLIESPGYAQQSVLIAGVGLILGLLVTFYFEKIVG
jgi:hypothetical protein